MARLTRRSVEADSIAGLTIKQRTILLCGVDLGHGEGFSSPTEYESAWWRHRCELMLGCLPFHRPEAFWWVECGVAPPGCPASKYRTDREALLDLKLQLSPREQGLLSLSARTNHSTEVQE